MSKALMIVDVQNDFTEGGALAVTGGTDVARGVSEYLSASFDTSNRQSGGSYYSLIVASRDWHDADNDNGGHFATESAPDFVDSWPVHCVAGTPGAEYHPELDISAVTNHILKGQGAAAYSMFDGVDRSGRTVAHIIGERAITDVDLVGIATDFCVLATALDAVNSGLNVTVFTDLVAGVAPESSKRALERLVNAGVEITTSGAAQGIRGQCL